MFTAKIFCFEFSAAKAGIVGFCKSSNTFGYFFNILTRVFSTYFSFFPFTKMIFLHMFTIIRKQFKIFNPIIYFVSIYMMDAFTLFEFSSKMLFHYISVLKNSFTIYIDPYIAERCYTGLPFFEVSPIGRDVVISVPKFSASMHLANAPLSFFKNIFASLNFANVASYHI